MRFPHSIQQHIRLGLLAIALMCLVPVLLLLAYAVYLLPTTPSIEDLRQVRTARPSVLLAANGEQLAVFRLAQQQPIELKRVSPFVTEALLATEDHRFYQHHGVDFLRTIAACLRTLGGNTQGGSTITQQLARNLFPGEIGRERSITRKLKEIITALKVERTYTKEQILETYLNTTPFLFNAIGIEMAARTYYGKSAAGLDALESATLIGMLKGTRYYNPVVNPERAFQRRNVVLAQMVKYGRLSPDQYQALRTKPLQVRFNPQPEDAGPAPHFAAHVRKWLLEWADEHDYDIYSDGLIVHTTLDSRLQEAASRAVEGEAALLQAIVDVEWSRSGMPPTNTAPNAYVQMRERSEPFKYFWTRYSDLVNTFIRETLEYKQAVDAGASDAAALAAAKADPAVMTRLKNNKTRLETGFVAIEPSSGEIKAWVGSRDFQRDQYDHVAQAERQPGSTFKPVVYGAALERGLRPNRTYYDTPLDIRLADGTSWRPTDMSGTSGAAVTLRNGLVYSKNVVTVQVMLDIGVPAIVTLARALGIDRSTLDSVPSLALGTSPVTLLEMVSAYSTIANVGEYRAPAFISRITDSKGSVVAQFGRERHRALSQESAVELIDMMRGVVNEGTGKAVKARFGIVGDLAGKTGTTQNNTDGWFILMHPDLVAGAWVGFNDARVTMRSNYWGQGGHNAVLVVGDFFRNALSSKLINGNAEFPRPPRIPEMIIETPPDDTSNQLNASVADDKGAPERRLFIRRDGTTFTITDSPGAEKDAQAKTSEELGQILRGMNRDPVTGASIDLRNRGSVSALPPDIRRSSTPSALPTDDLRSRGAVSTLAPDDIRNRGALSTIPPDDIKTRGAASTFRERTVVPSVPNGNAIPETLP